MTKRISKPRWNLPFKSIFRKMTGAAARAGSRALLKSLLTVPRVRKRIAAKLQQPAAPEWSSGVAIGFSGSLQYHLFSPKDMLRDEKLPLMIMLHGCGQNALALAESSGMNRIAARKRFFVLYPEQNMLANAQGCWNWFDTRSGRAQREVNLIGILIDQICASQQIDSGRIALAGLSAGASMAAFMAISHPERFKAVAMHSGIGSGVAHSSASAMMAMNGANVNALALAVGAQLPALLVIQGSADRIVAPANGLVAAEQWAVQSGALAAPSRVVQRGARYPSTITDYRVHGKIVVTFCEVTGLGHAWSGGGKNLAYSDPKGPHASGMIWAFAARQFALVSA
ncbi:poly(hydroxyalkanoate) depolymerase family esterase [Oxalobacteraceae bacterium GrIS 2.11]